MLRTPQRLWQDTFAGIPYQRGSGFRFSSLLGSVLSKAVPFLQNRLLPAAAKQSFRVFMDLLDGRPLLPTIDEHIVDPLSKMQPSNGRQKGSGFAIGLLGRKKGQLQRGGALFPDGRDASLEVALRGPSARMAKNVHPRRKKKVTSKKYRSVKKRAHGKRKAVRPKKRGAKTKKRGSGKKASQALQRHQLQTLLANL